MQHKDLYRAFLAEHLGKLLGPDCAEQLRAFQHLTKNYAPIDELIGKCKEAGACADN